MLFTEFPRHVRLLLLAARYGPYSDELQQMHDILQQPVDWEAFANTVIAHKVAPLVLRGLEAMPLQRTPLRIRQQLSARASQTALRAARTWAEIRRVRGHLNASGKSLVLLKGLALAQQVFHDPALRHVGDLDLLTSDHDLPAQLALFHQLGYHLTNPSFRVTPGRLRRYARHWKDLTLEHTQFGHSIDLHWRLFNNPRHPANRILDKLEPAKVAVFGIDLPTLPPIDHLLFNAAHGLADGWLFLKGLTDVAAALRGYGPAEVETMLERAAGLGLLPQISSAVHLAREWMGVRLQPTDYPRLLPESDALHREVRRRTLVRLVRTRFRPQRLPEPAFAALRQELRLVPGVASAAAITARFLWRPRVLETVDLPEALAWMHPVLGLLLPPRLTPVVAPRRTLE